MSRYRGQSIALLTQHGKERVIAPALEPALGCHVQLVTGYDTDQLGTFTRDKPRPGSQLEAARRPEARSPQRRGPLRNARWRGLGHPINTGSWFLALRAKREPMTASRWIVRSCSGMAGGST